MQTPKSLVLGAFFLSSAFSGAIIAQAPDRVPPVFMPVTAGTARIAIRPSSSHLAESSQLLDAVRLRAARDGAADQLDALTQWNRLGRRPAKIGLTRTLPEELVITFAQPPADGFRSIAHGILSSVRSGSMIWATRITVAQAIRLRVHLTNLRLPPGSHLLVYGTGEEPRAFDDMVTSDDVWSPSVGGDTIHLEVDVPWDRDKSAAGLRIGEIMEVPGAMGDVVSPLDEKDSSCLVDATCVGSATFDDITQLESATALLQFVSGSSLFLCTGTLLTDRAQTLTPYMMTANHCISTQPEALSVEAFWDYRTSSCNGTAPVLSTLPRSVGATLIATGAISDYTLVQLSSVPGRRYFMGWSSSALTDGSVLNRVSFPSGMPQGYSHSIVTSLPSACGGAPRPQFVYSSRTYGGAFHGSSGSGAFLAGGYYVGQLLGGCGLDDPCNATTYQIDGAFATTYPFVAPWLDPAPPQPCLSDSKTMCLNGNRFRVTASWQTATANGTGTAVQVLSDSGYFWFFGPTAIEVVLKVVNGCGFNSRYWVFAGGLTNVSVTLTVTDTVTGSVKTYSNPQSIAFQPIQDTAAFAKCP